MTSEQRGGATSWPPIGVGRRDAVGLIPLVLSAYAHFGVTRMCFRADDYLNLYQINNYSLGQYLVIPNAGHLLLWRNIVFYASWLLFGTHAWPYLWSAYLLHLLNVALLYLLIVRLTGSRSGAVFGAGLWGVCPLHVGAIGYYAVFGHVMVGTAVLLILWQATGCAARAANPTRGQAVLWYALALAAATSFGTGIGFAMALPFMLAMLLPRWRATSPLGLPLASLLAIVPVLYVALHKLYEFAFDWHLATGAGMAMTFTALPAAPVGFSRMLAFALFRLLFGPLPVEWTFPIAYALFAALVIGMAVVWYAGPPMRRPIGAVALLVLASYGVVVLPRLGRVYAHPATVMNTDGRMHYMPLLALTLLIALLWPSLWARLPRGGAVVAGAACTLLAAALALAPAPPDHCAGGRAHLMRALISIALAIRWAPADKPVVIGNQPFAPAPTHVVFPGRAALFTIYYPDNVVDGRRVLFVEPDSLTREWAKKGRRSRTLLIAPPETEPAQAP